MANMLATFAQFERRLISQRTKEALAVKKASGVRLGRPPTMPHAWCVESSGNELVETRCDGSLTT
jgi:DNA invertase Pin-like site-specific DNA recombinase